MDATIVYVMMVAIAIFMAILPFSIFMGIGSLLNITSSDTQLLVTYFLAALVFTYATSFGAFALVQKANCGSVKNLKQVASNAGISLGIQSLALFIAWLFPSLRRIISGLLPPDLDPAIIDSVGYSYFSFWASLFGTAIGGTLSGICG